MFKLLLLLAIGVLLLYTINDYRKFYKKKQYPLTKKNYKSRMKKNYMWECALGYAYTDLDGKSHFKFNVVAFHTDLNEYELVKEEIKNDVENKLKDAGNNVQEVTVKNLSNAEDSLPDDILSHRQMIRKYYKNQKITISNTILAIKIKLGLRKDFFEK